MERLFMVLIKFRSPGTIINSKINSYIFSHFSHFMIFFFCYLILYKFYIRMEAISGEVILVLLPLVILGFVGFYYVVPSIKRAFGRERERPQLVEDRPRFGDGVCSICLQNKRFQVSATCGHSYCGRCLFDIYDRVDGRIPCPLCRMQITTIFKCFNEREGTAEERERIQQRVRAYNDRFDDNRPFFRRLGQIPNVLRRLRPILMSPFVFLAFVRSIYFLRSLFLGIVYILFPLDLIPERFFGIIGFIDDIMIFLLIISFALAAFGVMHVRHRH